MNLYEQPSHEDLLYKYQTMVYKLVFVRMKNQQDAEDVFQETFIRLVKYNPIFKNEEHEKAWLLRVAINCCNDAFSQQKKHLSSELHENISNDDQIEDHSVLAVVGKLSDPYKTAIHLFYYEDLPIKEIALIMDQKESTVKSHLHRGKKLLKILLEKEGAL